jgi:hypothetical protein
MPSSSKPRDLVAIELAVLERLRKRRSSSGGEMKAAVSAAVMFYLSCPASLREYIDRCYAEWRGSGDKERGLEFKGSMALPILNLWMTYADASFAQELAREIKELSDAGGRKDMLAEYTSVLGRAEAQVLVDEIIPPPKAGKKSRAKQKTAGDRGVKRSRK